jgi:8-oxo-dGTP diphosphatase
MAKAEEDSPIKASGCVVYRWVGGDGGTLEVLVAHRPLYDDWDFPKGKLEDGETDLECATRETEEETGYTGVIGLELPSDHYQVRGRDKVVRWWLMEQSGGAFVANEEVDEVRWLSPDDAAELLSYDHAKALLAHLPGRD